MVFVRTVMLAATCTASLIGVAGFSAAHAAQSAENAAAAASAARANMRTQDYERDRNRRNRETFNMKVSEAEEEALRRIQKALTKKDYAKASLAISEAQAMAETAEGKYMLAALQLQLGNEINQPAVQDAAIAAALESGVAPKEMLPELYRRHGVARLLAGDTVSAEAAFAKLVELEPQDAEAIILLAESKNRGNKYAEALPLIQRAIAVKTAANQEVPDAWSRAAEVVSAKLRAEGNRQQ